MKNWLFFLLFILFSFHSKGQLIPNQPVVSISYDLEETSFKQLPSSANVSLLTDLEKVEFKKKIENSRVNVYLDRNNDVVTEITYLNRIGFEGTTEGPMKRLVMDKNGSFRYDSRNQLVGSRALDQDEVNSLNQIKPTIIPGTFMKVPEFVAPTDADIRQAASAGTSLSATTDKIVARNSTLEYVYDKKNQFILLRYFDERGKEVSSTQSFYILTPDGSKVPSFTIDKYVELSVNGLPVEHITMKKYSNYTRRG